METPERIWFLLSRNLSGDATPADMEELHLLLQQQPGLMQQYELLQQLWPVNPLPQQEETTADDAIRKIIQRADTEEAIPAPVRSLPRWRKWMSIAAAAVVLFTTGWLLWEWKDNNNRIAQSEIVAPRGSKTRTILPDGTTVWLNAGSRIRYSGFNGAVREVTLEGEAYFDVVHAISHTTGRKQPFIVHAGNINIEVLGTAFNVKSYPEEKNIETTLLRGLIQITRQGEGRGKPLLLHPNEKVVLPVAATTTVIDTSNATVMQPAHKTQQEVTHIDSTLKANECIETAWVYNRLEFRGDTFEQLAARLERWYNVKIYFEDAASRKLVFTGTLESETIEQAFTALKAAVPFTATINNNEIFIKSSQ